MVAVPELIILAILVGPVLTLAALLDLLRRPAESFPRAGQDRVVWALVIVLVGFVGPILYLTLGRSRLDRSDDGFLPPAVEGQRA